MRNLFSLPILGVSHILLAWGVTALGAVAARSSKGGRVPRGVAPADAAFYVPGAGDTFTCRSGSPTLAYGKVNDNYCDCPDGSDEPGTSACSTFASATFYCPNRGDEARVIFSQFVDDGICDCCDGSDEVEVTCPDTCAKEGQGKLAKLELALADAEEGLRKNAVLRKEASDRRAGWEKRLEYLEEIEIRTAQENVKAEIAKKNAETRMERAQQLVDRLAENLEKMNASSSVVETDAGDAGDADGASDEAAGPDDAPFEGDEVEVVEEDETEEERAKRVASQWIHDEDDEDDEDYEEVYDAPGFEGDDDDDDSVDNAVDDADNLPLGLFDTIKLWIEDQTARLLGRVDVSRELKLAKIKLEKMKRLSNEARNKYQEKNRALRDLEREVTDLTTKQRYTYGDGDAFLVLSESCIASPLIDGKHSYSLCPFGAAKQMEGGKSTGLGTWEGFADVGGEAVMRFVNGDACWQGPRRSMEVSLKCGSQDSLDAVSEPSRCTYAGILTTPAFCSESIVEGLKKEIKRRRDIVDMVDVVDSSAEDKGPHQEL